MESFYAIIKREWLNRFKIQGYQQAYKFVFEYIKIWNCTRRCI
ncbi:MULTISPECIES: IS3 family transposase [unclassified Sedimentibacter]